MEKRRDAVVSYRPARQIKVMTQQPRTPKRSTAQSIASDAMQAFNDPFFELSPVPLWLEDFSAIKLLLDDWRTKGVRNLRAFLAADLERVAQCTRLIRVLAANRRTLDLFGAADMNELIGGLDRIFKGEMLETHVGELTQLFEGALEFSSLAVNYTLAGKRLDVQLKARILPGHEDDWSRVLVSTEDVTDREEARRRFADSEQYARGLFEYSPVSLWVEDFSSVRHLIEGARSNGVVDFPTFLDVHPEFVRRCMSEIRLLDVNRHTLALFGAPDLETLTLRLDSVFRDAMENHFREQLIDLWNGKLFQQREVVNYTLGGEELHLHMQFSVFPGREADWSQVQVALTDITARKKAEAYLEFLGKHDVLTKLYNRSYYVDEINRLERRDLRPITVIAADLNALKAVNDTLGHAAGDALLRRAGEVLAEAVVRPNCAARIGGDEFVVLMPGVGTEQGRELIETIENLIEVNNQFYPGERLSFAMGVATSRAGERLEETVKRADEAMYDAKRAYYEGDPLVDRRRPQQDGHRAPPAE